MKFKVTKEALRFSLTSSIIISVASITILEITTIVVKSTNNSSLQTQLNSVNSAKLTNSQIPAQFCTLTPFGCPGPQNSLISRTSWVSESLQTPSSSTSEAPSQTLWHRSGLSSSPASTRGNDLLLTLRELSSTWSLPPNLLEYR